MTRPLHRTALTALLATAAWAPARAQQQPETSPAAIHEGAEDDKKLCSERPGLSTQPCVQPKGHLVGETALVDWTLERGGGDRTDTILVADTLLRYGLGHGLELRFGWTPFGSVRERDDQGVTRRQRVGDVTLGGKAQLLDAGDKGLSLAVIGEATLPVGRTPVGAGDWGASARVPISYDVSDVLELVATPEIDAAVDEDGQGRHLAYGGAAGADLHISRTLKVDADMFVLRDRDPDPQQRGTKTLAGLSGAYQPNKRLQVDMGANWGLSHAAADVELYAGVTRRF